MKKARKLVSAVVALAMAAAFAPMSAFADSEPTTVKQDSASNTGAMTATYDAQPSYTVTIPASAKIADKADNAVAQSITAENVLLDKGKKLVVTLTNAENTDTANATTFNAKNGDSTVNYNILNGENKNIALGSNVAKFENKTGEQTVALKFVKEATSTPTVAGTYSEALTFGIAVEDAAPAAPSAANNVGDVVHFGEWDWYVIDKRVDGVTLLMKENLMNKAYNDTNTNVTWATCSLRTYLNEDFYNRFSDEDKAKIIVTQNITEGAKTDDHIYLLCIPEANLLDSSIRDIDSSWWLRSPGNDSYSEAVVNAFGTVDTGGLFICNEHGVRPALNLEF